MKNSQVILKNIFCLLVQSEKVILSASNIKNVGVQGAYTHKFLAMEKILDDVQDLLKNMNMSAQELATTENLIAPLRSKLSEAAEKLNETARGLETTEQQIKWVDLDLNDLNTQMNNLLEATKGLKENATKLQEANVEGIVRMHDPWNGANRSWWATTIIIFKFSGALNLTRKAQQQSLNAEIKAIQIFENVLANSERQCKRAMTLYNRSIDEVNTMRHNNDRTIATLKNRLEGLNEKIPQLNEKVCGKAEVCDETCGGAKCGTCGGISCDLGAVTKANASFELVKKADQVIKEKEEKAEELLRGIAQAKQEASVALNASQEALMTAESAKNGSERAIKESSEFFANLEKFFSTPGAKPADIRAAAEEVRETIFSNCTRTPGHIQNFPISPDLGYGYSSRTRASPRTIYENR